MTNGTVTSTPQRDSDGEETATTTIDMNTSKIYFEITQDDDDDDILRDVDSNNMTGKKSASKPRVVDEPATEEGRDHIKRPLNAFMIWAQAQRKVIMTRRPKMHNAEISRMLGVAWRTLPEKEKDIYRNEAVNLKDLHRVAYPNYKFRPRKRNRKRRRSGPNKAVVADGASPVKQRNCESPTTNNQENSSCFTHQVELIRDRVDGDDDDSQPAAATTKVLRDHSTGSNQQQQQNTAAAASLIYVPVHHSSSENNVCYQRLANTKVYLVPIKSKLSVLSPPDATSSSCHRHHNDSPPSSSTAAAVHPATATKTVYITTTSQPLSAGEKRYITTTTTAAAASNIVVSSAAAAYNDDDDAPPALVKPFTEDFLPLQDLFSEPIEEAMYGGSDGLSGKEVDWAYVDMEAFIEESCTLLRFFENLGQSSRRRKIANSS